MEWYRRYASMWGWMLAIVFWYISVYSAAYSTTSAPRGASAAAKTRGVDAPTSKAVPRRVIPLRGMQISDLADQLHNRALFYLVDKSKKPITASAITAVDGKNVVGSHSLRIPSGINIAVEVKPAPERWIQEFLNMVEAARRPTSPDAASQQAFSRSWAASRSAYIAALKQIMRYITLTEQQARDLEMVTRDGTPVTLLFVADPYPTHTVMGSSRSTFQDKLAQFINAYQLGTLRQDADSQSKLTSQHEEFVSANGSDDAFTTTPVSTSTKRLRSRGASRSYRQP
jgi:hypothetical protein